MLGDQSKVDFLQEFIGYCLVPDTRYHIGLFMEGEGSNGKGVFCKAVETVFGDENTRSSPLESWNYTFDLQSLQGALINFSHEVKGQGETPKALPTTALKWFISGDRVQVERKYRSAIQMRPTARLIICWNRRPRILDDSDGMWRRVRLVQWLRKYSNAEADKYLNEKITAEASGILNWAIEGYVRLRRRGEFTETATVSEATEEFRRTADPCRAFIEERLTWATGAQESTDAVWSSFNEWCEDNDVLVPSRIALGKAIKRKYPAVVKRRDSQPGGQRPGIYIGLLLKGG
jgi:putative DNA primase/helicase